MQRCDELPEAALRAAIQRYPKVREADFCDNKKGAVQSGAAEARPHASTPVTASALAASGSEADAGEEEYRAFTEAALSGGDRFWSDLERWLVDGQGCSAGEARGITQELQRRHAQSLGGCNLDSIEALAKSLLVKEEATEEQGK